ncbi:hypothetical protein, partial [Acetobacter fabarum]|uniref:hypothetical protein n=1 Tax=Acetobacter fabarum TaxID=483199 RepID=UPI0039ED8F98
SSRLGEAASIPTNTIPSTLENKKNDIFLSGALLPIPLKQNDVCLPAHVRPLHSSADPDTLSDEANSPNQESQTGCLTD